MNSTGIDFSEMACRCGCRRSVNNVYRQGHDAAHASRVARRVAEEILSETKSFRVVHVGLFDELPTNALRYKAHKQAEKLVEKARAKKAKPEKVETEPVYEDGTVKVGRWTYPAMKNLVAPGDTWRNSKRDGSGQWQEADPSKFVS